jgi:hypothetical protein
METETTQDQLPTTQDQPTSGPAPGTVAFGDKSVELSTFDRYKGTKGKTDRIAILSGALRQGFRYYVERLKLSFVAPTNPTTLAQVKKMLGDPEQGFGLVVFHYTTDDAGELLVTDRLTGKVKLWRISESRYEELSKMAVSWPLLNQGFGAPQVDLTFSCKDEQYQKGAFLPVPQAHWKTKQAWYDALMAKEAKARAKLPGLFGRTLSDTEILEKLGVAAPAQTGSTGNVGDLDVGDVLEV